MKARESVLPGSKAHQDITDAVRLGVPWVKNGYPYKPIDIRREGRFIIIDLELLSGQSRN